MENTGFVHVYTGEGKGKTTAAFGLALRAACAGRRVYVGQFVKDMEYNECGLARLLPSKVAIEQLGRGCFIDRNPSQEDVDKAIEGLNRCKEAMSSGEYSVVILDEVTIAVSCGLLTETALLEAVRSRGAGVEVVITGRYATPGVIEAADLVTEMREVKHYYKQGVASRDGIDH